MEIWDGYLMDGSLANQDLVRGEPIPKDLYHLVSEILVRHVDGDYLIMQRDFNKPNYGGYYEATAGGSALKGEDKITCAMRELLEETGTAGQLPAATCHPGESDIWRWILCQTTANPADIWTPKFKTARITLLSCPGIAGPQKLCSVFLRC